MTGRTDRRRPVLLALATHLVVPLALFYGLRAAGVGQWWALMAGAAVSATEVVVTALVRRRIDTVSVTVLGIMVMSAATAWASGTPRLLLAKNAWGTAALGAWLLVTLALHRPLLFDGARMFQGEQARTRWDENWRDSAPFRNALRVLTFVWGCGFLVDAGLRLVMAFTLPVDLVPLLDDALLVATVVVLLVVQTLVGRYYRTRHGVTVRAARDGPAPRTSSS